MGKKLKVFLVDDDPLSRSYYWQILSQENYGDIEVFESGAMLKDHLLDKPDIIFLDYLLADTTGSELLKSINEYCPEAITIILSGQQDLEVIVNLMNNGAFDYVIKGKNDVRKIKTIKSKIDQLIESDDNAPVSLSPSFLITREKLMVREAFASELHDNINPLLITVKLFLETALSNVNKSVEYINESKEILAMAIKEIRTLSHEYLSGSHITGDLESQLQGFLSMLKKQNIIEFSVQADTAGLNNRLDVSAQHEVLLIIKEIINNLVKYSGSADAQVKIEQKEESLSLMIKDNGKGFDSKILGGGLGMKNISKRILRLKGTYMLVTEPGKGCTWNVNIPLKKIFIAQRLQAV